MTTLRFTLLLLTGLLFSQQAWSDDCAPKHELTWVKAQYALSGDTLVIQDQRVRLNGIHAPQIPRIHKFNTPGQPLAKEAQTFLNKLLANNDLEVGVEYDTTQVDRFNRQLVHLFLKDGTNVQQEILKNGYAIAFTDNQNSLHARCYFEAEQQARQNRYQLWDLAQKKPQLHYPLVNSSELRKQDDGFRIIRGQVERVEQLGNHYVINLDTTGIRIPKHYWQRFDLAQLKGLQGKIIEVRGLAYYYKGAMYMIIEHPNAIDRLNPLNR
ncbi:thermonuclease family protein [Thiomicrorhabdus sp. zzn3]|uniref:thermonuclease family protein n=1 Tax=Thiomicrorhabdus sp. zzn3 TaxID=3039775 RepID=UPI0024370563|nr:thermonuclease family protein [Thiomicrorhabdus sp. zzn3]MDG6778629.1 thermonuclease family protein [Thiomicrorhabdus sp. zzn3]